MSLMYSVENRLHKWHLDEIQIIITLYIYLGTNEGIDLY